MRKLLVACMLVGPACGGPQHAPPCQAEHWSGYCQHRSVVKTAELEFPVPMSVFEVIYTPEPNQETPNLTPPEVRREYRVRSLHEPAFQQYLTRYARVGCRTTPPAAGTCSPGPLSPEAPEFDPRDFEVVEQGPRGCDRLDSGIAMPNSPVALPPHVQEPLLFDDAQNTPSQAARSQLLQLAEELRHHPHLECVLLVGSVTLGEPQLLATQRAARVKDELIALGIAAERLRAIRAESSFSGQGPREPQASERSVTPKVVLSSEP